ncbi:Protein HID1 [Hypsizygus marmoreus]|uniref:Protein HID1 n=1 Tax=Hypsizygus marmoreus TaxID=39966 RepID=A0A369JPL3_HYPMA|nr:Protein HID1 [Hypsizygus marmoreus]
MFAKIPQRFTAPFGLLGDEAKLAFPSQPGGIAKLATTRNIPETDSYWNQYFVLFDSASDVFSLITPNHIRRALLDAPENIATLIRVVTARLFNLISDHTFPSSSNASVAAFASSFIKTGTGADRNTRKEVLNCIRILQRVLPVVFEVDGESNAFELEVLWKKEEVEEEDESRGGSVSTESPQFVIEDDDDSEDERSERTPAPAPAASGKAKKKKKQLPSLGEKLFSSIMDLLFCCGFTLPTSIQVDHYKINYVIWEKGVGSTADVGPSHAYDSNKTEVLRLLLVLLSRQIYVPPGSLFSKPSLYSLHLVQKMPRRDVLTLLCSLLNTAMNSSSSHDNSIGGMAGSMAGKLPYNHLVFKGEDPRSTLVTTCFQVLCALLDFQSGSARDAVTGTGESQTSSPTARTNAFRYFLVKLHRPQDFEFIMNGIVEILEQQMVTMNKLLPGARKSIPYVNETVIFFWKMIELNKKFRTHVLQSDKSMDLVAYLLCYALEIKDKPQQHGFCRALSYIIQTLSAEPAFGSQLTRPVKPQLPTKWNAAGTAADFMVNAIYAIVATTSGALNSLYPALIIALANSAPHFKDLTVTASTRLIQLFTSFSNPLFLLADEGHPRLLFFMLEIFNSVVLHHLSDNPNLIYGILTAHKAFEDLGTFTLARGLREIKRVQVAKEEQQRKAEGNPSKGKGPRTSGEDDDPGAEKARLLESEGGTPLRTAESAENLLGGPPHAEGDERKDRENDVVTRAFMSPTSESPVGGSFSMGASEKARGKMKERRSLSLDTNGSLDRIAAAGVGRNGFVPTQEWVTSWQQGLPLDSVMLLISELLPKVQEIQATRHKANSTSIIVDFLSTVTLKHVLPERPIPTPRRFMWSDASVVWLTSLIWGEIYVRGMTPLGIWNATNVRLFYVKHSPNQPRQITEAVSNVVGGFLRRNSDSPQPRSRS